MKIKLQFFSLSQAIKLCTLKLVWQYWEAATFYSLSEQSWVAQISASEFSRTCTAV